MEKPSSPGTATSTFSTVPTSKRSSITIFSPPREILSIRAGQGSATAGSTFQFTESSVRLLLKSSSQISRGEGHGARLVLDHAAAALSSVSSPDSIVELDLLAEVTL